MSSRRSRFAIALVAILLLAGFKAWQNTEAVSRRDADVARRAAAGTASFTLRAAISRANFPERLSRREVEVRFNGGRTIATRAVPGVDENGQPMNDVTYDVGTIVDPTTFAQVTLDFRGDVLYSTSAHSNVPVPPTPLPPLWNEIEAFHGRLVTTHVLPAIWVVGMVCLARDMDRNRRVAWLVALLVVAIAWAASIAVLSKWWLGTFRFTGDMEYWLWPPLAIAANLFFLRETLRSPRDPAVCAACGYDLTGNVSGVCPECGTARAIGT